MKGGNAKVAGFEPVTLFSALASLTKDIGFVVTFSTTHEERYSVARKFASLCLISDGRAVWNVVTTATAADWLECSGQGKATRRSVAAG